MTNWFGGYKDRRLAMNIELYLQEYQAIINYEL